MGMEAGGGGIVANTNILGHSTATSKKNHCNS